MTHCRKTRNPRRAWRSLAAVALLLAMAPSLWAQASCSSDGQPRPAALQERFISADCADCWSDAATPRAAPRAAVLDWVVPGTGGEDAPLSAVALREGSERLAAIGLRAPAGQSSRRIDATGRGALRVAHGLPFNGYIAASIEWRGAGAAQGWLALVEQLPAGTEGSPVPRQLVRNLLRMAWPAAAGSAARRFESRPLSIPPGANPERLAVVGWIEDPAGHIVAIAQSGCAGSPKRG